MTSDHKAGEEATTVTVTVSETCTAVAYDKASLQQKATQSAKEDAAKQLDTHYRLIGVIQVTIVHASLTDQKQGRAIIALQTRSTWVYQFTSAQQRQITHLIAGNARQQAISTLAHLDGIQQATVTISGGCNDRFPTDPSRITLVLVYGASSFRATEPARV